MEEQLITLGPTCFDFLRSHLARKSFICASMDAHLRKLTSFGSPFKLADQTHNTYLNGLLNPKSPLRWSFKCYLSITVLENVFQLRTLIRSFQSTQPGKHDGSLRNTDTSTKRTFIGYGYGYIMDTLRYVSYFYFSIVQ